MARLAPPTPSLLSRCVLGSCLGLGALSCSSSTPPAESPAVAEPEAAPMAAAPEAEAEPATTNEPAPAPTPAAPADARGKEQIQAVIAANRERVRACYEAALKKEPGIQGDLVVAFVINPDGSVKSAEVNAAESELHVPELDSCAIDVLQTLKFPASSRGLESKVNYPFNFKP